MLLYDMYDTQTGLYNQLGASAKQPLSSVAYHESYNVLSGSALELFFKDYIRRGKGIYEKTGLSIVDILNLPKDYIDMIYEIVDTELEIDSRNQEDMLKQLNTNKDNSE